MRNKKLQVWLPLLFSLVMILGMVFGFKLNQQTGSSGGFFKRDKRTSLQEALDLIKDRYVDNIGIDSLQDDAINEVMNHLDPHSVYIPASDVSSANEDLVGNFEGIGVEFNIFEDTVHVLYVVPDGPSDKAGVHIGDKIIKVNDSSIIGNRIGRDIRKLIRGKGGTKVKLTILRGNTTQFKEVVRGTIPLPSLDAAYMMDAATGYIKLSKFAEPTYREFMQALENLQKQGMQKLILDLRSNGGGYVKQAVNIADEFLDDEKLIVYTHGANVSKEEYKARRPGLFEKGKLVILVDEYTASASEILAGSLQDWDRATIIGRRTYGKGLVQGQYDLSDGSAIRLTIARYYTPSGRSIQRPYDKGRKEYMSDISQRFDQGEMFSADSFHYGSNQKTYKTLVQKRTVYGGGGIVPDIFVPLDTSIFTRSVTQLYLDGRFNNFVYQYYIDHQKEFDQFKNPADFANRYQDSEDAWKQLVAYALKDSIRLDKIPQRDKKNVQDQIKAYLARLKWRTQGYYQVYNNYDHAVIKAKEVLNK
jgi:carboxyl-terminal processing protease